MLADGGTTMRRVLQHSMAAFSIEQLDSGMEREKMILATPNDAEFISKNPLPSDAQPDFGPQS